MMRWLAALLVCCLSTSALAQTGTAQTPSQLNQEIINTLPNNTAGSITPAILRQVLVDMVASANIATAGTGQIAYYNSSGTTLLGNTNATLTAGGALSITAATVTGALNVAGNISGVGAIRTIPTSDFVNLYAYGGATNNNGLIEGDNNNPALTVGSRTKNSTGTGAPAGLMAFGFNDRTTAPLQDNWAIYAEDRRYTSGGTAVGMELDITEFGASFSTDPYAIAYALGNMSAGIYIQSGGSCTSSTKCYNPVNGLTDLASTTASVALAVGNNGAKFYRGLQFNYNALDGNDGMTDGQFGQAIIMPRGDAIQWDYCTNTTSYPANCASSTLGAFILGTVKSSASVQKLEFDDTFGFLLANGNNSFMFQVPVSTSYVNGVQLQPSATGATVAVKAIGSDTDVNLTLTPKGAGAISLGSAFSSPGFAVDGTGNLVSSSVPLNVKSSGAKGDTKTIQSCGAIISGTAAYSCAGATFTAADVGKTILVHSAGAASAPLKTTITTFVNSTSITLAANASTTVSGANNSLGVTYGTDDTIAVSTALGAANGQCVFFPKGAYWLASQTTAISVQNSCLQGDGSPPTSLPYTQTGSVILISNTATQTFSTGSGGLTISGMTFFWPGQDGYAATPVTYPALIEGGTIFRTLITNSNFVNPYQLVKVDTGGSGLGVVRLSNVLAYCINICFGFSNGAADVLQIENSDFSVGIYQDVGNVGNAFLGKYTVANGELMHIDISGGAHPLIDGLMLTNTIIHGYGKGIRLVSGQLDVSNITGNNWDAVPIVLSVEGTSIINTTAWTGNEIYAQDVYTATNASPTFNLASTAAATGELTFTGNHISYAMGSAFSDGGTGTFLRHLTLTGNTIANIGQTTTAGTYYGISITSSVNNHLAMAGNNIECGVHAGNTGVSTQTTVGANNIGANTTFNCSDFGTTLINAGISGAITSDGFAASVQSGAVTAENIHDPLVPGGWFNYDGIRSAVVATSGTTAINTNGFGFYVRNSNASTGSGKNAVGLFGAITCEVNNCASWGLNPTLNDSANNIGTGGTGRILVGGEFDFTVVNAGTTVQGISLNGSSNVQPTAADGFTCGSLSGTVGVAKWSHCFVVGDGMANVGMYLGPQSATGINIGSASIQFAYRDGTGTGRSINLTANSDALYTQGNHTVQGNFSATGTISSPSFAVDGSGNTTTHTSILPKITATAAAPGSGNVQFEAVAGSVAGTCKIIAYAGTSATPTTVIDNIGAGC